MHSVSKMSLPMLVVAGLVVAGLLAAGCGGDDRSDGARLSSATVGSVDGAITVSAAASLTEAFGAIGRDFEAANPEASVAFNFGSSSTLAIQIGSGAPADVFASADGANMNRIDADGLVRRAPVVFAANRLVIVTKPGNPKHVAGLPDLASLDVVSLCAAAAPCGAYADQVLRRAGASIPETRVTRGQDVKTTIGAVATGDADAAIVYVTDARSAGESVDTVRIPDAQNATASYPIAVLETSGARATATAFVDAVTSPRGRATLRAFGFLPPP